MGNKEPVRNAAAAGGASFSLSGGMQRRKIIRAPSLPAYPAWAAESGVELSLEVELLVDRSGRTMNARVVRSSGDLETDQMVKDFSRKLIFERGESESRGKMAWEFRLRR